MPCWTRPPLPAVLTTALLLGLAGCSDPTMTAPAAPTDVRATAVAGAVQIDWNDNSLDEDGFIVYRSVVTAAPANAPMDSTARTSYW